METSIITKLFGKNAETETTIFHEIAEAGALQLLRRIRDNVKEPMAPFLKEKNKEGNLCTHVAVAAHKGAKAIQVLKVLLELGADCNALSEIKRFTILQVAVNRGDHELVKWLAQLPHIDLNIKGWDERTAYEIAIINSNCRIIEILKTQGARAPEPEISDDWEYTLENRALMCGCAFTDRV